MVNIMDDILVVSDCCYAKQAVITILKTYDLQSRENEKIAIFMYEKKWLSESEIRLLLSCEAKRIIVFGDKKLLAFLNFINPFKNVSYACYGNAKDIIARILRDFIFSLNSFNYLEKDALIVPEPLSYAEARIVKMYLDGMSVHAMTNILNINYKTVCHHKHNAMKKMCIKGKCELINAGSSLKFGIRSGFLLKENTVASK